MTLSLLISVFNINAQKYAEVLEHSTHYNIVETNDVEITESVKIRILNEHGKYFGFYKGYTDKFRQIRKVSVDIFDKEGKKIKHLNKNNGHEYGFNPSYEISDGKILIIEHDYQQYPYTVEIKTTIHLNGYISLPTWTPRYTYNLAVKRSEFKITYPKDMQLRLREEFVKGIQESKKQYNEVTYTVYNLSHINKNIRYKDFYDNQQKVRVAPLSFNLDGHEGSFESWKSFGDWFLTLNDQKFEPSKETLDFISKLDKSNKLKLIQELYNYMQDKTRYISIQLGIGGFQSLPSEDVEQYGYGDCKALSMYMKNLLELVGIGSNYILARAGKEAPDVIQNFPSNQFNHVFIGVPMESDTVFLECTSQINPVDYVGTFTDDRNLLWVEKNNSAIIRGKKYETNQNIKKSNIEINLDQSGDADILIKVSNSGIFFDEISTLKLASQDYVNKSNQKMFQYKDFTIRKFDYNIPSRHNPEFESSYEISVNGLAESLHEKLILPTHSPYDLEQFIDHSNLKKYASIKRGFTFEESITVNLSGYCSGSFIPENISETSEFGSYTLEVYCEEETLKVERRLKMEAGDYTEKDFEMFTDFYKKIQNGERQKSVLNIKT